MKKYIVCLFLLSTIGCCRCAYGSAPPNHSEQILKMIDKSFNKIMSDLKLIQAELNVDQDTEQQYRSVGLNCQGKFIDVKANAQILIKKLIRNADIDKRMSREKQSKLQDELDYTQDMIELYCTFGK